VMPSALARFSSCRQTGAGKRIERGTVGPVSVPLRGRPGATWNRPPARCARVRIGAQLDLGEVQLWHFAERCGRGSLILRGLLHSVSSRVWSPPSADEPDRVLVDLHVNHEQQPRRFDCPSKISRSGLLDILCDAANGSSNTVSAQRNVTPCLRCWRRLSWGPN